MNPLTNNPKDFDALRADEPKWKAFAKIAGILLIIFIPLVATMAIFGPIVFRQNQERYKSQYVLLEGFQKSDLVAIISHMRDDREFVFYFAVLSDESVRGAVDELYTLLDRHRGPEPHFQLLEETKAHTESLATLFLSLNFPEPYYDNPLNYPDLNQALWTFLYEEFKLSVIGACYKSTHNLSFSFDWDRITINAAEKLIMVVNTLTEDQRRRLAEIHK